MSLHVAIVVSLTELSTENMRHACRGTVSASGRVRALEAASSHTKKHGRRNKKSPSCEYDYIKLCVCVRSDCHDSIQHVK